MSLATLDKLLDEAKLDLEKLMAYAYDSKVLAMLNKVQKHKVFGRGLDSYMPFKLTAGGAFGRGSEGGAIPAGVQSTSAEGKVKAHKLWAMVMDFNHEEVVAMSGGRERLRTSLQGELSDALEALKHHKAAIFGGQRGDGVLGRVNGSITTAATITLDRPFTCIEGDVIESWDNRGTKDASRTGNNITTAVTVVSVDHENNTIKVSANTSVDDEKVIGYSSGNLDQESSLFQWPMGLTGHVDDVNQSTSNVYDTGDAAAYDHVDTYMNLARGTATYDKLNCQTYDAGGSPVDEFYLSRPATIAAEYKGAPANKLLYYMHPDQWSRCIRYFTGLARMKMDTAKIQLPGRTMSLPVIIGIPGATQVPVITSPYINDGFILCLTMGDFDQMLVNDEWVMNGGSKALLVPGTSTYVDTVRYAKRMYWNSVCRKPYRQVIMHNLSTSN